MTQFNELYVFVIEEVLDIYSDMYIHVSSTIDSVEW